MKFGILLGYFSHPTSRAQIRLAHLQTNVYTFLDNISDPPISKSNQTSSKPTRLGADFKLFFKYSYEIPNPTRSAIDPPEFDPTANYHHLQLSIPCKSRLYTWIYIQITENNPRTQL